MNESGNASFLGLPDRMIWIQPHLGHVVTFLDRGLDDDYVCFWWWLSLVPIFYVSNWTLYNDYLYFVASNKQQI